MSLVPAIKLSPLVLEAKKQVTPLAGHLSRCRCLLCMEDTVLRRPGVMNANEATEDNEI